MFKSMFKNISRDLYKPGQVSNIIHLRRTVVKPLIIITLCICLCWLMRNLIAELLGHLWKAKTQISLHFSTVLAMLSLVPRCILKKPLVLYNVRQMRLWETPSPSPTRPRIFVGFTCQKVCFLTYLRSKCSFHKKWKSPLQVPCVWSSRNTFRERLHWCTEHIFWSWCNKIMDSIFLFQRTYITAVGILRSITCRVLMF